MTVGEKGEYLTQTELDAARKWCQTSESVPRGLVMKILADREWWIEQANEARRQGGGEVATRLAACEEALGNALCEVEMLRAWRDEGGERGGNGQPARPMTTEGST